MKKITKSVLCVILAAALVFSLTGCAKVGYVFNGTVKAIQEVKSGDWKKAPEAENADAASASTDDPPVIDEFAAGTFGGVEFKSIEDGVKYYCAA